MNIAWTQVQYTILFIIVASDILLQSVNQVHVAKMGNTGSLQDKC